MNHNKVEEHIRQAITQSTPDVFEKVSSAYVCKTERMEQAMKNTVLWNYKTKMIGGLAAACLMLGIVFGGYNFARYNEVDTTIAIDVNPSVEITTNKADKVLNVIPLNEDAVEILGDMNLKRVNLDVAINAIMGSMVKHGYITNVKNSILVTVENEDDVKADAIKSSIVLDINSSLQQNNIKATVFNQKVSADKNLEDVANKYNISYGKAVFLYQLTQKDPSLTMEKLASLTLEEIASLVSDKRIDLHSIVDYETDETVRENIEDGIEDFDDEDRKPDSKPAQKDCEFCSSGCACDECEDDDGCDRWCDECPDSCKNTEVNKPGSKPAQKDCKFCSPSCTCDECEDDDGCDRWCDECPDSCKNAEVNKPSSKPAQKNCKFCSPSCTCDECEDDDGCDRWCDECPDSCKNAEVNKPSDKQPSNSSDDDDNGEGNDDGDNEDDNDKDKVKNKVNLNNDDDSDDD
ncbi:hypothetical protein V6615_02585 [Oscillospiraceae bacterium PP1C4]